MTDEEYVFHETSRERKRNGRGDFNKKRQGGKHVRLSSDHITRKEWEKMNSECVTIRLDEPMNYTTYTGLPDSLKAEYLKTLWEKYGATPKMIGDMLGVDRRVVLREHDRLKMNCPTKRGTQPKEIRQAWDEFICGDKKPEPKPDGKPEAEPPKDIMQLFTALIGTGAKITIELTL